MSKHYGDHEVRGRLVGKRLIVGDLAGTSYEFPQNIGNLGDVLTVVNQGGDLVLAFAENVSAGGGVGDFLSLTDTPSSFAGSSGFVATVNVTEDGLVFTDVVGDLTTLTQSASAHAVVVANNYTDSQISSFTTDASGIDYTPSNPSDWSPVPNDVAEALDTLAADLSGTSGTFVNRTGDTMTGDLSFDSGANIELDSTIFTPANSGNILSWDSSGFLNDTGVAAAAVTSNETRITVLESQTDAITAGLGQLSVGIETLNTTDSVYTISHPPVTISTSIPQVSLTTPGSGSAVYIQTITNRTTTSFDVVLSGTPEVSGYSINWAINISGNAAIVKYYDVNTLTTPTATPNAGEFDTFYLLLDQDTALNTPTGMLNGQTIQVMVEQDGSGGWDLTLDSGYEYPGGLGSFTVTPSAGAVDILTVSKIMNRFFIKADQDFS